MKGGTACSLRSRCPPFDPHVVAGQSPTITSVFRVFYVGEIIEFFLLRMSTLHRRSSCSGQRV